MRKIIVPFGLVTVIVFSFLMTLRIIKISNIECFSQYGDCPVEITSKLESVKSKSLSNSKKEISKILRDNFLISDFSTQFKLPSTLKVNLVIRKAVFALRQKDTDNYTLIDKDGYVVAISNSSNLPTVIVNEKLKNVGEKVSDRDLFSLKLINGVFNMYQVNFGDIRDDSLVVELPSDLTVIFPLEESIERDSDFYLGVLRLIVTKIETENSGKYREIDLRFKNPVLR